MENKDETPEWKEGESREKYKIPKDYLKDIFNDMSIIEKDVAIIRAITDYAHQENTGIRQQLEKALELQKEMKESLNDLELLAYEIWLDHISSGKNMYKKFKITDITSAIEKARKFLIDSYTDKEKEIQIHGIE